VSGQSYIDQLGPANISIAGFHLWVHNRQFPEATDYWDSNWVNITAHCRAKGAEVWVEGPIIHLSELDRWIEVCQEMHQRLAGEANLDCMEPELSVRLRMDNHGHIAMRVAITPDHLAQEHIFHFAIDQSYLPGLIGAGREILRNFPLREAKA
jgi:hypothetical protein